MGLLSERIENEDRGSLVLFFYVDMVKSSCILSARQLMKGEVLFLSLLLARRLSK